MSKKVIFEVAKGPIIIIGMHRSGTTMIASALEQLGLFIGGKKNVYFEAIFFYKLNNWLFDQSGATWDDPMCIHNLLNHKEVRTLSVDYIKHLMKSIWAISFMGVKNFLKYRDIRNLDIAFGWKDPRSTFTLPIWLEIFPEAKIIYIYRHGVDVAQSIRKRIINDLEKQMGVQEKIKRQLTYWVQPLYNKKFIDSLTMRDLKAGLSLWEIYNKEAMSNISRIKNEVAKIKYEDFLSSPYDYMCYLADYCRLATKKNRVQKVLETLRGSRAYAYKKDPLLCNFADEVNSRLKLMGY